MEAAGSNPAQSIPTISNEIIGEYLSFLELKGVMKGHIREVERYLKNYKKHILSVVDKKKRIEYLKCTLIENILNYQHGF